MPEIGPSAPPPPRAPKLIEHVGRAVNFTKLNIEKARQGVHNKTEKVKEQVIDRAEKKGKERERKKTEAAKLGETREVISDEVQGDKPKVESKKELLYKGKFEEEFNPETGQIELPDDIIETNIAPSVREHKLKNVLRGPALLRGRKVATGYEGGKVPNFSSITSVVHLPDGRRVMVFYKPPSFGLHKWVDDRGKGWSGLESSKARQQDWKSTVLAKSRIATVKYDDPDVVVMPFVPNVNAYDLFRHNRDIQGGEEYDWASGFGQKEKIEMGVKMVQGIEEIHKTGIAWGEPLTSNTIVVKDRQTGELKPIFVDPEVSYTKGMPLVEQQARDLRDVVYSVCAGLKAKKGEVPVKEADVVGKLLGAYANEDVKQALLRLVNERESPFQMAARMVEESNRLRITPPHYDRVRTAMRDNLKPPAPKAA